MNSDPIVLAVCSVLYRLRLLITHSKLFRMAEPERETFKLAAVNSVLGRLGDATVDVLKFHLKRHYSIELSTSSSFTIEQLDSALQKLICDSAVKMITKEIRSEIDRLAKIQAK